jgi:HEAT repeat protein
MRLKCFIAGISFYLAATAIIFGAAGTNAAITNQNSNVSALIQQLDDNDESTRLAAAKALIKIGPSVLREVGAAVSILRGHKADRAIAAFTSVGSDAVPMMMALVRQSGDLHDNSGVAVLAGMGSNAIPGLEITLRDRDPEMRGATIDVLRIFFQVPDARLPAAHLLILAATTEKDDLLRVYAIDALGYFGLFHDAAPEVVCKTLHELLSDPLEKARLTAAYSLAKFCHDSVAEAMPLIVKGILSDDKELAWESAFSLNSVGTNALAVMPELAKALDHVDPRTADELLRVLANLGDPAFTILKTASTNTVRDDLRSSAIGELGEFCTVTKTNLSRAILLLSDALKDANRDVRAAAVNSLRYAATENNEPGLRDTVARKLVPMQQDPDQWIRDDVKRALEEIKSAENEKTRQ